MAKRKQGRPEKWQAFIDKLDELFDVPGAGNPIIIYTDKELVEFVNMHLEENQQISVSAFEKYKRGERVDDEYLSLFVTAYKRALFLQKQRLMEKLESDVPGGWQRYAWILERKFDEWNLRSKSVDETPDVGRLVFRVMSEDKDTDSD